MADSRLAILMALFLPNKEFFTNFVVFNHALKHEDDRWNYFQCHTKLNLRVATILAWFSWLCYHVNWKLHHSLTVRHFVECTISKKSHDLLVQFVNNGYSWFWQFSNCTRLKAREIWRTEKITRTYLSRIVLEVVRFPILIGILRMRMRFVLVCLPHEQEQRKISEL